MTTGNIDEHKQVEKALRENNEMLRALVDGLPDTIIRFDRAGRHLFVSDNVNTVVEFQAPQFIGKTHRELGFPAEMCTLWEDSIRSVFDSGKSVEKEFAFNGKKGHTVFNWRLLPEFDAEGNIASVLTISRDITFHRNTEHEYKTLFREMLNGFAVHEIICDAEGKPVDYRFLTVNPAFERMTGLVAKAVVGRTAREVIPHIENYWIETYGKVALSGEPVFFENYVAEFSKHFEVTAYCPAKGLFACIFQDVTERKHAVQALQKQERQFRTLAELVPVGIYLTNPVGDCLYANPAWCKMAGLSLEDALGKGWIRGLHPDDRDMVFGNWKKMVESRGQWGHEYRFMTSEGIISWVYGLATPQYDSSGTIIAYVGVNQDITLRKQFEDEKNKYEHQRNQMQKLESIGLLAGGIAHDFNNLLGGIFGYIELANEASSDQKVISYLSQAMNTIDRARALTQQLLTFAKGGAPIRKIGPLFPFVEETARFALSGANVSCQCKAPKDLWACNFDKNQIGQVIDNIIINAQQAMPLGGTITLSARNITLVDKEHPLLANGNYVKISVKDSGVGIQKEFITNIFDPFFTTKAKGHGLGLATCYSIIKQHGGCIDVESEPGKGSIFHIYLPAQTGSVLSSTDKPVAKHKGSGTFLIMDDHQAMRDAMRDALETLGYSVVTKEDGKDAIDYFVAETKADRKISGMIFDLTVPGGMGGKEAIQEIRKINNDIPVFVASGYAEDNVMKDPVEFGFTASICKPFRLSELSEMLNNHMQAKQ